MGYRHGNSHSLKMSVNRASTIFGVLGKSIRKWFTRGYPLSTYWQPSWAKERATRSQPNSDNKCQHRVIDFGCCILYNPGLCYGVYPESTDWQLFWAQDIATWSQHQSENERQQSVNDLVCWILHNPRAVLWHLPIIEVLAAFISNMVCSNAATPQVSMEPPQFLVL